MKTSLTQSSFEQVTDIPLKFLYQTRDAVSVEADTQHKDYDESLRKKAKQVLKEAQKEKKEAEKIELRREQMHLERQQIAAQLLQRKDRQLEEKLKEHEAKLAKETQERAALDVLILQLQAELERVKREREEQTKNYEEKILALTADTAHETLIRNLRTQVHNLLQANLQLEAQILDARNSTPKRSREKEPAIDDPSSQGQSSSQKKKHKEYKSTMPPPRPLLPSPEPISSPPTSLRRSFTSVFDQHVVDWLRQEKQSLEENQAAHEKFKCRLDYEAKMTFEAFRGKWGFGGVQDKFVRYLMANLPVDVLVKCSISNGYSIRATAEALDTTFTSFDSETGLNWRFILTAQDISVAVSHRQITGFFKLQCFVRRHGNACGEDQVRFKEWITQQ
jgi:hypothetical protein